MTSPTPDPERPVVLAPCTLEGDLDGLDWFIALATARVVEVDAELVPETWYAKLEVRGWRGLLAQGWRTLTCPAGYFSLGFLTRAASSPA